MLSNTLELTLRKALHLASSYKHEYATYEHLLLALMEDEDVKLVLIEKDIFQGKYMSSSSHTNIYSPEQYDKHSFNFLPKG